MKGKQDGDVVSPVWDIELLHLQVKHKSWLPESGKHIGSLDLAFTDGPRSDDTCLVSALVTDADRPVLWIKHIQFGKFSPKLMAQTIGDFYMKWMPEGSWSTCEAVNGSTYLQLLVEQEFARRELSGRNISWIPASRDRDSKNKRIEKLARLHRQDRLRLVNAAWNQDFMDQAERWSPRPHSKNRSRQDDLLDATALLTRYLV